jgi:hypothetical protein
VDLTLTVILGVLQLVLGTMGVYVSIRPPVKEKHRSWIVAFLVIGLLGAALTAWIAHRADLAQNRLQEEINGIHLQEAQTTGELSGIKTVMQTFVQAGIPGLREFAQSIIGAIQNSRQHDTKEEKVSDSQLCSKATMLAQNIRAFQLAYDNGENNRRMQEWQEMVGKKPDEMSAIRGKQIQDMVSRDQKHNADFQNGFMSDARYVHDQIIDRLPVAQRDALTSHNGQAEGSLVFVRLFGANDELEIAAYLDQLSKALCSKQP